MIERASEFGASTAVPLIGGGDTANKTAGDLLREAREAHGLHLEIVAAALKVPPQKLAALEADQIESLPDRVFARALAASVCRALRIDPAPVLAKLPVVQRPGLAEADRTMSSNIRSSVPRAGSSSGGGGLPSRAMLIVVGLLLVGAAVLFWLPQSVFDRIGASMSDLMPNNEAVSASDAPRAASEPGTVVETVAPSLAAAAPAEPQSPAAAVAPAADAPPAAASSDAIVFVARAEAWITVTEAGGRQLLRRTLKAGETVGLSGALPLSVVVGRASGVDVQVHGKPFDLAPVTRGGGVARFEVKS